MGTQKPRRQGPSPDVVKRIRSDEVLKYFKPKLRSNKVQKKEGSKVGKQGILSPRCEVRLEKIYVEGQLTECRGKPLAKVGCHGNILQALVLKPKTIKQVLHNKSVYSKFNEGHEDDLFGKSKGQVGFGPLKKLNSKWEGKSLLKDDSSGDESGSSSKSDVVRGQSPARWSLACQPVSPKADESSDTPERSRWQGWSPVVLHTERQRASFQLRKLKERSKTEVKPSRMEQKSSRQISKRSSLWFGESAFRNKVVEKGVGDKERIFEEMVAEVKRYSNRREDTPDSDCEKYFTDDSSP